jgi:hypothetical protein
VSVYRAVEIMGVTVDAIRKRVARNTIPHKKDEDGRVWVILDIDQDTASNIRDTDQPQSATDALIFQMQERIASLERQLDQEREANSEHRRLLLRALERIPPQLEAPSDARESPHTVEEQQGRSQPHAAAGEAQESSEAIRGRGSGTARGSWWRRMFGG